MHVLYEDNHLLAVSKPASLPTMGVAADKPSLLRDARAYLKQKYDKPGNVYVGIVSRLDAPTTGLVLMARTSKAASRLTEQFRDRNVEKLYWAVVPGDIDPTTGECLDWLRKDERHRHMKVCRPDHPAGQEARLEYRLLERLKKSSLVEVRLHTGRKHQIRVQFAHRGWPILGDRKYGSERTFPHGIALHGRRLVFEHPIRHDRIELVAPLPLAWQHLNISHAAS